MQYLRQSTASQSVLIGPFVDSTDGNTAETALTINAADIRLSANGGNMFAKTLLGGTHDEAGWYTITLDATDSATVGRLQLSVHVAGALPVFAEFQVLEEVIYDALFAASANTFTGAAGSSAVTALQGHTAQTGDTFALANGATGFAAIDTVVDAILLDTGTDGVVVATGSKTGYTLTATTGLGNQTANITGDISTVGSVTGNVGGSVGSVAGNVGGNVVGSVATIAASGISAASFAAGAITAGVIATDAIGADEISAAAANKLADHIKRRTQANTDASSDGDALNLLSLYGLVQQAQESNATATPGSLTVYRTDGTTVLGTRVLASDATADPVVGIT